MITSASQTNKVEAQVVTWNRVITWMHEDAYQYGIPGYIPWMDSILWCESRGNPYAVGYSGEIGPAQFHPRGVWSQIPIDIFRNWWDVYDVRRNIRGFVWAIAHGLSYHWSCA